MTHWNHRVMRRTSKTVIGGEDFGDETFDAIYEVYYNNDGTINGWTQEPSSPKVLVLDDEDYDLKDDIKRFLLACEKPILDWETGKEI